MKIFIYFSTLTDPFDFIVVLSLTNAFMSLLHDDIVRGSVMLSNIFFVALCYVAYSMHCISAPNLCCEKGSTAT